MAGTDAAARCLPELKRRGRIVQWMGVAHVSFPTWTARSPS
jgi:hypothetical protein